MSNREHIPGKGYFLAGQRALRPSAVPSILTKWDGASGEAAWPRNDNASCVVDWDTQSFGMNAPLIRSFESTDTLGVFELILPIQRQEFGVRIEREDQPDLSSIPSFYQRGTGGFWVAEHMGQIVGTIGLKELENNCAALRKMFVAAPFRGAAQGPAAKLLRALIEHARNRGIGDIYLGTTEAFLAAHRFYEKNGFMEIPQSSLPADFPVMEVDRKFYRLSLS